MTPNPKIKCPATGFKTPCAKHAACCPKFVTIRGKDPQTGAEVDQSGCVDGFLPMLLIENAKQTRQAGAAIESFRNEVVAAEKAAARERAETVERIASSGVRRLTG